METFREFALRAKYYISLQLRKRNVHMESNDTSQFHPFSRKYGEREICFSFNGQDLRDQPSDRYLNTSSKTNTLTKLEELVRLGKKKNNFGGYHIPVSSALILIYKNIKSYLCSGECKLPIQTF